MIGCGFALDDYLLDAICDVSRLRGAGATEAEIILANVGMGRIYSHGREQRRPRWVSRPTDHGQAEIVDSVGPYGSVAADDWSPKGPCRKKSAPAVMTEPDPP